LLHPADLDDGHSGVVEEPLQPGTVGTGSFDPKTTLLSELVGPVEQRLVAGDRGWDLDAVESSAELVDRDCGLGVDTHDDLFVWHDFGAPNHQRLEAPTGRNGGQDS